MTAHRRTVLALALALATGIAGAATPAGVGGASPAAARVAQPASLPQAAYLAGVGYVAQTYNNCGPASIIAALAAYGYGADQGELARRLRPAGGYMTADVIDPFLRAYGLAAPRYKAGSLTHLRRLVAAGYPVIVLQWLDREGGIPHFRVVRGYDDHAGVVWISDSIYGANAYLSYSDFERLWAVYNREFIPVVPTAHLAAVQRLILAPL